MISQDRAAVLRFAQAAVKASSADIKTDELPWRVAEEFGWDTPGEESGGLRLLSMAVLMLSLDLRDRADQLDRWLIRRRAPAPSLPDGSTSTDWPRSQT
jgi:hypothetical protein